MKGYQTHEMFWADLKIYCNMIGGAFRLGLIVQIVVLLIVCCQIQDDLNHLYVSGTNIKMPATVALKYYTGYGGTVDLSYKVRRIHRPLYYILYNKIN